MRKKTAIEVSPITRKITRLSAFLVPLFLTAYGFLRVFSPETSVPVVNVVIFTTISIIWVGLGVLQFILHPKSRQQITLLMIFYHALAFIYILMVSGADSPIITLWIILLIASLVFFGTSGLYLSILTLFSASLLDIMINIDSFSIERLTGVAIMTLTVIFVGVVTGTINSSQEVDRQDLTRSRIRARHERDRALSIINNLADAIISTDQSGIIQIYNASTLNLLDTNTELAGQPIDKIIHLADSSGKPYRLLAAFRASQGVTMRDDLSTAISGETIKLSVVFSPIRSADNTDPKDNDGYTIILRDITKQKSLEEERDEFISVVSHELRTPITVTEGSLSNVQLMMKRGDIPQATLVTAVESAHDQVVFLSRMVNDLATLSRAERGVADQPEPIDVDQLINDLYNEYSPQATAKHLRFDIDKPTKIGQITASRLYLKELLQNFVTNAIKYTKKGQVTVQVTKSPGIVTFQVEDSGIGISKSDLTRIFDKFWRSEDYRTRETGGTGLGLYVARKLSRKLGTEIKVASKLNHGSTFSFSLPIDEE